MASRSIGRSSAPVPIHRCGVFSAGTPRPAPSLHQITFDCFGGAGLGVPTFSGTYSWEFTIGPL